MHDECVTSSQRREAEDARTRAGSAVERRRPDRRGAHEADRDGRRPDRHNLQHGRSRSPGQRRSRSRSPTHSRRPPNHRRSPEQRSSSASPGAGTRRSQPAAQPSRLEDSVAIVRQMQAAPGAPPASSSGVTAADKAKRLWAHKKQQAAAAPSAEVSAGANRWDMAEFDSGAARAKFQRLMGVKSPTGEGPVPRADDGTRAPLTHKEQERLQREQERHYAQGLQRTTGGRLGLGL